ncbi:copper resistance protein CopC [Leucobacter sp. CSA1]|uniref:Copper resistance protein CopC n=1 Tax=Leucobacter chromiisoli TaxID=2796471 RepID=A0A934UVV2_9MICO|nr:copper resistance CopC family protein [Leucobacter chromiisoli]MBK0419282.1 copper resistance protein CopC [Leucobacter chromiisoli]
MSSHTHVQNTPGAPLGGLSAVAPSRPRALVVAATALTAAAALCLPAAPALAHDELVDTGFVIDPADGSLEAVQLTFNNEVLTVGTEIVVSGPDGADAADGDPEHRGRDVLQPLTADLSEGGYDVVWRVVSSDGHPIEGAFSFEFEEGQTEPPAIQPFDEEASAPSEEAEEPESEAPAEHEHGEGDEHDADEVASPGGVWPAVLIGAGGLAAVLAVLAVLGRRRRRAAAQPGSATSEEGGER